MSGTIVAALSQSGLLLHLAFDGDGRALCGTKIARHAHLEQAAGVCDPCQRAQTRHQERFDTLAA